MNTSLTAGDVNEFNHTLRIVIAQLILNGTRCTGIVRLAQLTDNNRRLYVELYSMNKLIGNRIEPALTPLMRDASIKLLSRLNGSQSMALNLVYPRKIFTTDEGLLLIRFDEATATLATDNAEPQQIFQIGRGRLLLSYRIKAVFPILKLLAHGRNGH